MKAQLRRMFCLLYNHTWLISPCGCFSVCTRCRLEHFTPQPSCDRRQRTMTEDEARTYARARGRMFVPSVPRS